MIHDQINYNQESMMKRREELKNDFEVFGKKLQKCCVGLQILRNTHDDLEDECEKKHLVRAEMERRLEETSFTLKKELETSRSMMDTKLKLNKIEIEQSFQTNKFQELKLEVKLLRLQRGEMLIELERINEEIAKIEEAEAAQVKDAHVDESDVEDEQQLRNLLEHNFAALEEEQVQLKRVLEWRQRQISRMQDDRKLVEKLADEVNKMNSQLTEEAITKQVERFQRIIKKKIKVEVEECPVVKANPAPGGDTVEKLELILAEKLCELENVQRMIEETHNLNRSIELAFI